MTSTNGRPSSGWLGIILGNATLALCTAASADLATDRPDRSQAEGITSAVDSETSPWFTDMERAKTFAAEKQKTILMDFTGSDWCGWCSKLSEEVFDTPEFKSWADEKLVLVQLDFPNDRTKTTQAQVVHNEVWLKKLKVAGFPTIYLTDHEGRPFAKTGYKEGGPEEYIKHLKQLLQVRMLRDTAMDLADEAEGADKVRFLDDALSTMDAQIVGRHYTEELEFMKQIGGEAIEAIVQKYDQILAAAEGGAEAAGMVREDWMADPFGFLGADMQEASDHLDIAQTEPPVEEYHPRIEDRLTKLIELMNKTSPKGGSSQSGSKPNKPASASSLRENKGNIGDLRDAGASKRVWAKLPPKERERILQSKTEGFPSEFDDILADYYRQVAREQATDSED